MEACDLAGGDVRANSRRRTVVSLYYKKIEDQYNRDDVCIEEQSGTVYEQSGRRKKIRPCGSSEMHVQLYDEMYEVTWVQHQIKEQTVCEISQRDEGNEGQDR